MAALSGITAVRPTADTKVRLVQYGATIAAGNPVYLDSADSKYKLADNNASSATATVVGIAVTPGIDTGYGYIATSGSIVLVGTTMVVGKAYYAGATAGELVPESDLATGNIVAKVLTGSTATQALLGIEATGIVHA